MITDLTPRQKSVLEYILHFQQEHCMAPTVREIGAHFGLSAPAGIHRILNVLKEKGYLLADKGKKRSWRFSRGMSGFGIPVVGDIAAGLPVEAVENFEEELAISPEVFGSGRYFAVRVRGDSMIDAHIMDGDLAVIRSQQRVENGEIAAVMIKDLLTEVTLKILHRTRAALYLEPANPAYETMVFKGPQRKRVSVLGKLAGVVRRA